MWNLLLIKILFLLGAGDLPVVLRTTKVVTNGIWKAWQGSNPGLHIPKICSHSLGFIFGPLYKVPIEGNKLTYFQKYWRWCCHFHTEDVCSLVWAPRLGSASSRALSSCTSSLACHLFFSKDNWMLQFKNDSPKCFTLEWSVIKWELVTHCDFVDKEDLFSTYFIGWVLKGLAFSECFEVQLREKNSGSNCDSKSLRSTT